MVSPLAAYTRLKKLAAFRNLQDTDFRPSAFAQKFGALAAGASTAGTQPFPGGAIILGIESSAYMDPLGDPEAQLLVARSYYGLGFSFTNNEALTVGGPVNAEALLGAFGTIFPARELVIAPNQSIVCQVTNYSILSVVVHVVYHAMVYRTA